MLAYVLALAVGLGSLAIYMAAFSFQKSIVRMILSGVGWDYSTPWFYGYVLDASLVVSC
jgi:hypothetical protein